jgi:hypothetical protein
MLEWGLSPTHRHAIGSFVRHDSHFTEATDRIIVPFPRSMDFLEVLMSSRECMIAKLMEYPLDPDMLKCSDVDLPDKYILFIPREGERGRTLLNSSALISYFEEAFDVPLYIPNLKYGCNLADNMRFFRDAIGFVATHGAAFTNINFIAKTALILQFSPTKPHPFINPTLSLTNMGRSLGHAAYTLEFPSTKEPRWDMFFNTDIFNRWACNKPREVFMKDKKLPKPSIFDYAFSPLKIWEPTIAMRTRCYEYLLRVKAENEHAGTGSYQ